MCGGSLRPFLKVKNKTRKRWKDEGKEGERKVRGEIVGSNGDTERWSWEMGLVFASVTVMG